MRILRGLAKQPLMTGTEQEEPTRITVGRSRALLANPSLRALADDPLDLATYSSGEDELHEIESKCIAVYRSKAGEISRYKRTTRTSIRVSPRTKCCWAAFDLEVPVEKFDSCRRRVEH
jgi:hypothetical protein